MAKMIHNLSAMRNLARRLSADRRGVSALITAFALTALMGFAGLAVDVIMWEVNLRSIQGAADQAALGAATAFRNGNETTALGTNTTAINAAYATATRNGYPAASVTVAAYNNGSTCTNSGCIKVTITQAQQRYFTRVFSNQPVNASASAVGTCSGCGAGAFNLTSNGGNPCVMALDASGSGVITASGNPTMSLNHCDLYNNSPNTNATILNGKALIQGCTPTNPCDSQAFLAQPNDPSGSIDIPVNNNSSPAADPYAGLSPPTVGAPCVKNFPANPVPSGTYCPGNINNQSVQFAANSTIVITGGLSTKGNSSLACTGCMLYVLGGASLNANATIGLAAPTTGPYAGVVVWFGDSSSVTWNGGNTSAFKGAIYAPSATVNYIGNAASASTCTRLVAAAISLGGTSDAAFDNSGCPALAGPVRATPGVTGKTAYTGSPMLIQ